MSMYDKNHYNIKKKIKKKLKKKNKKKRKKNKKKKKGNLTCVLGVKKFCY